VTEANGIWGSARQVPGILNLNTSQIGFVTSVSCASPGNCTAAGSYTDHLGHIWPFVVSEKNAKWGKALSAPGVIRLSGIGGFGQINSVSCASAGNCAGAGQYDDSTSHSQAFVIVQSKGTWTAATKVPGLSALNKGNAEADVVSCDAPAGCSAGGIYHNVRAGQEVFVLATR
jgi:hypothetical protein